MSYVVNLTNHTDGLRSIPIFENLEIKQYEHDTSVLHNTRCKYMCIYNNVFSLETEDHITVSDMIQYRCTYICTSNEYAIYEVVSEEQMYLNLMEKIMTHGRVKTDRTGVGTRSLFGERLTFSLQENQLPVMTSKKVPVSIVLKELLWFIRGETDNTKLKEQNVHIWDKNGSRETLDRLGFQDRQEGDLGPVYGYQWRHWGASYPNREGGIDQLQTIVHMLKTDSHSRRMILNAWNVSDLSKMALPPCHLMCQFYATSHTPPRLSCNLYQRSGDVFLGVPFNITSYSALTHIVAHMADMQAHELNMFFGDVHLYTNHIQQATEQLSRKPLYPFPKLHVRFAESGPDLDQLSIDDLEVTGYQSHSKITADMAV